MIYVNGCSYSLSNGKNYGDYLSEITGKNLLHKGIKGSSNDRIFRTTTRDLLKLKQNGINDCLVCVGLTFWFRTEIWIENHGIDKWYKFGYDDGEFVSFQTITDKVKINKDIPGFYKNYFKEWIKNLNVDGAIVNTMHQSCLLLHLCKSLGYNLLIFWAADVSQDISRIDKNLESLKDFYNEFNDKNSFDLLQYCFVKDCFDSGYKPFDSEHQHGHPDTTAHKEFAYKICNKLGITK
jgi:hypothetical protein